MKFDTDSVTLRRRHDEGDGRGMMKMQRLLLSSLTVSLLTIFVCADAQAITILQPATRQTLYVGTQYLFVADLAGAGSVTATDNQTKGNLACTVTHALAVCADTPLSTTTTLKVTFSTSGQTPQSLSLTVAQPKGIYPQGDKMQIGSYAGIDMINPNFIFTQFIASGQNTTQLTDQGSSATGQSQFVDAAANAFTAANVISAPMASLSDDYCVLRFNPNTNISNCETYVLTPLLSDVNFKLWEIDGPEEAGDGGSGAVPLLQSIYTYVRQHDTRPFYAYINGGLLDSTAGSQDIQNLVPYVDLVGAGAYRIELGNQPGSLIRWTVEQEIAAINQLKYSIGPNFNTGHQKTPMLINETICYNGTCTAAADYRHDVFAGLSAGAQGILTYFYYGSAGGQDISAFQGTQGAFAQITSLVNGSSGLGEWALKGLHQADLQVNITSGPATTTPLPNPAKTSYPSVRAATFDWAGTRIVIAVNSNSSQVTATMSGLPASGLNVQVLGESRTVPISSGVITETFAGSAVHIYQVPLVTQVGATWKTSN